MNETDAYREFPAPDALRGSIACLWLRRGDGRSVRVLPDGCSDIVWRAGAEPVVAGPDTRAWLSGTTAGQTIAGVRFRPGAGGAALRAPLAEVRDQRVPLSELGIALPALVREPLDEQRLLRLLTAAAQRLVNCGRPDAAVQAAVARLRRPGERVEPLAAELGLSERQLRRRFLAGVGYGPKTLQRVLRLRLLLAGLEWAEADVTVARAAADAGYADQAHLARECRALTGLTPRQLRAAASAGDRPA